MKVITCAAAALFSLTATLTTAAMAADSTNAKIPPVHVKVVVTSKYYGSFTQERDVKIHETASFSNFSAHHSGVVYHGQCALKPDATGKLPEDIDDGVIVNVTPVMIAPDGKVGAHDEVRATKLIRYNKVDSGICGEIAFAESKRTWSESTQLFHPGEVQTVDESHEHSETDGDKDLTVTVSFSPVPALAN